MSIPMNTPASIPGAARGNSAAAALDLLAAAVRHGRVAAVRPAVHVVPLPLVVTRRAHRRPP